MKFGAQLRDRHLSGQIFMYIFVDLRINGNVVHLRQGVQKFVACASIQNAEGGEPFFLGYGGQFVVGGAQTGFQVLGERAAEIGKFGVVLDLPDHDKANDSIVTNNGGHTFLQARVASVYVLASGLSAVGEGALVTVAAFFVHARIAAQNLAKFAELCGVKAQFISLSIVETRFEPRQIIKVAQKFFQ